MHKAIIKEEDIEKSLNASSIYIEKFYDIKVDLSLFPNLVELSGHFDQMVNLNKALFLKSLIIWSYNKSKNDLSFLINLKELFLRQGNIVDLKVLESLTCLQKLEISYLSKLKDISALVYLSKTLNVLEIENCKKITNLEFTLSKLENLHVLKLIGLEIENINWVKYLPKLQQLIITNTNILNGDIRPAKNIGYVAIDNKRHYNYKFDNEIMNIVPKH